MDDARLIKAKAIPIADVAEMLGVTARLTRASGELVGPCPNCGGTDRFGINPARGIWLCRKACWGKGGGDGLALVQMVLGKSFPEALDWLAGPAQTITPEERAAIERKSEAARRRRAEAEARKRREARAAARAIWDRSVPADGTMVADYLALRGITGPVLDRLPPALRFVADCPYTVPDDARSGHWRTIHVGPAMIAAVALPGGGLGAVHRTWLDLARPSGKAVIVDPTGQRSDLPSKKVLGSKKGGAIRLLTAGSDGTLYMGEGIETTLSAAIAGGEPRTAAFWAGVDLGNMGGRRQLGEGLKYAGRPDLSDDDAFVPPSWVTRLIYVQDGDSEPRLTRAILEAGLRRAMARRRGLTAAIIHAGAGRDLNDVLREGAVRAEGKA